MVSNPNAPALSAAFLINAPLVDSISTSHAVYQVGQPVAMTFVETNSSAFPIVVQSAGTFTVTNVATAAAVFSQSVGQNALLTLQPGQSLTQTATWTATQPGSYGLEFQNGQLQTAGSFQVVQASSPTAPPVQNPPPVTGGDGPPVQNPPPVTVGNPPPIQNPPPVTGVNGPPIQNQQPIIATLTTSRQQFRAGQSVVFTLTLRNASGQTVTIPPSSTSDGFSVISGSTMVWHTARTTRAVKAKARILLPGQSVTFQAVWNGKLSQRPSAKVSAGSYTILASEGGYSAETTIHFG